MCVVISNILSIWYQKGVSLEKYKARPSDSKQTRLWSCAIPPTDELFQKLIIGKLCTQIYIIKYTINMHKQHSIFNKHYGNKYSFSWNADKHIHELYCIFRFTIIGMYTYNMVLVTPLYCGYALSKFGPT